ncbi:polysaccharide lyase family 8 super-sandwich domain-containing protein [Streptomyces boninensis]|uniref:polysaccharide lyase family 8 super-sandwich domain-containing protein n=1 Tax=Streptomyces boninensis TaxID=2039455 RepID=UPI003B2128CE
MEITRRRMLSLLSATGLLAVLPSLPAVAAGSADFAKLIANTVGIFGGTAESNARPEAAAKLKAIEDTARANLKAMADAADGELFKGLPLGTSDVNLNASYLKVYEIALATRTPGGGLDGSAETQAKAADALEWLHERYLGDQSKGYYGNWHNWEIAIPASVTKTFALLSGQGAADRPDLVRTYTASMDAYLRYGKDGDVDLDSRFHTGANLADITTNRILQGALLGDEARITKALENQLTVFATIDPYQLQHNVTDGYYADGSFIQHSSVAYTGSYGKVLLTRVVQTLKILYGTPFANTDELAPVVQGWVRNGFAPLIFEGWMMEVVKGRAVSRATVTGYADVAVVVEAVTDLSDYSEGEAATALKGYVKYVDSASPMPLDPAKFVSPMSVVRYADILADASVEPADLNPPARSVAFNAMDKHVHRRPGYAFALARSSDRISKYEYMSGENLLPWFQGDGAHYLYLAGQDQTQAFGADYYTTVSPYELAGVTAPVEERKTIPQLYDGKLWYDNPGHPLNFTSSSESQNKYVYFPVGTNDVSGGAVLDTYGAAAMTLSSDVAYADRAKLPDDFVVYRAATATKSWFMLDDEIVVLAAGIGDEAGRAVTTTLDARTALPADEVTVTGELSDGSRLSGAGEAEARWLRWSNATRKAAVGYALLDARAPKLKIGLEEVTRSRRAVRLTNPDTSAKLRVFTAVAEQPAGAKPASLAYALVPGASEAQLRSYGKGSPLSVVANSRRLQAIRHRGLGLTAANSFTRGRHEAAGLSIDGPASVLLRRTPDGLTKIAASDPTMDRDTVRVLVRGRRLRKVSADEGVRVSQVAGGTIVEFRTHQAYGDSLSATLRG